MGQCHVEYPCQGMWAEGIPRMETGCGKISVKKPRGKDQRAGFGPDSTRLHLTLEGAAQKPLEELPSASKSAKLVLWDQMDKSEKDEIERPRSSGRGSVE